MKIGVLALQGAVREHKNMLEQVGAEAVEVKKAEHLVGLDGLILPGGESTTIGKLIRQHDLYHPILNLYQQGKPLFGTCAGMVLLAKQIEGGEAVHLGLMDILVKRNAFGRQIDSFETDLIIKGIADHFPAVFIRAPYIEKVGADVEALAEVDGHVVAARQGNLLVTSFHPELTEDLRIHAYFMEMVHQAKRSRESI